MKYSVYVIKCESFYKVGVSHDVKRRIDILQIGNPFKLELVYSINDLTKNNAYLLESIVHEDLNQYNVSGEWFNCDLETIIKSLNFEFSTKQLQSKEILSVNTNNNLVSNMIIIEMWKNGWTAFR